MRERAALSIVALKVVSLTSPKGSRKEVSNLIPSILRDIWNKSILEKSHTTSKKER
jgi:hypothetical protein